MTYPVVKLTGVKRLSSLVKREYDPEFCRENFTLLAGAGAKRAITIGMLLALQIADGSIAVSSSADAENTGNGTLDLADPEFTSAVKEGEYTVVCTTGGADGTSKFRVESPLGKQVGTATGGTAFAGHVKFTINGGGTDFVEGDKFIVSVVVDKGAVGNKVIEWEVGADVWGLAIRDIIAEDGVDASGGLAITDGPVILAASELVWPDGITDAEKDDALSALRSKFIKTR